MNLDLPETLRMISAQPELIRLEYEAIFHVFILMENLIEKKYYRLTNGENKYGPQCIVLFKVVQT